MTEQQMTPIQYADQALAFADTKEKLTALAASSVRIVEITNKAGYQECHAARMALKTARVEIEKRGKDARADALAIQKAIIAKEKELVGLIEPEEQRLKELQDAVDQEEARQKAAAEEAERQRIAAINARFDAIRALPGRALNATAEQIEALLAEGYAVDVLSFPVDVQPAAQYEKTVAVGALNDALRAKKEADAEAERVAAQLAELAELRARDAERQAELDRLAAAEREREAAEARRIEEAARAEREAAEAAARKAREEEQARIDAERAERRRQEDAAREEAARQLRAEQEAARVEAERLAREKAELAERERQQAIASATLESAAREALALLEATGFAGHLTTQKLAAALARDPLAAAA
jgi:hypothetical protein